MPEQPLLRTGRKVGRTIYIQIGGEPSDDDQLVGVMDTPELAAGVTTAFNVARGSGLVAIPIQTLEQIGQDNEEMRERLRAYDLAERRKEITEPERAELLRLRSEVRSYSNSVSRLQVELQKAQS
jgi:phosphopantetheinyl transferase